MNHLNFRSSLGGAIILAMVFLSFSANAQETPDNRRSTEQGILLLQNGQIFTGRITQSNDRYHVAMQGGEISVPAYEVDRCCRSLEEAYMAQQTRWNFNDFESHFQLASWCHRQGLLDEAASELRAARALDPNDPRIQLIQNRLEAARIQSTRKARPVKLNALSDSISDLDRLIGELPRGTVETFTRSIQPILLNRCTTARCHGPNTTHGVEFIRAPLGQAPSQRLTWRNLQQTLKWVDREKPSESALLTVPVQPHGTTQSAIFTSQHRYQYEQIYRWVQHLAWARGPIARERESESIRQTSHEPTEDEGKTVSAVFTSPLSMQQGFRSDRQPDETPFDDAVAKFGRPELRVKRGASVKAFTPTDPFDPEIFNRRYFKRSKPSFPNPMKSGSVSER